jgi:hypothetical protein
MLKSIHSTKKLFRLKRLAGGKVDVEATPYLLSLTEDSQRDVLKSQLDLLRQDISEIEKMSSHPVSKDKLNIEQAQLHLLIHVVEGLLEQISQGSGSK